MSSLNPLPDGTPQDGTHAGDVYSSGTWRVINGQLVNVPIASDSTNWFPSSDGHPMEH